MSFGVVIVCSDYDFSFAKGCIASVKYFMPDVEICLLIDGNPDTTDLQKYYNVSIIKKQDVKNEFLKNNSFGWGITKMIAFWESPFDTFLLLDADICMWGDLRFAADFNNYDLIIDQPQYTFDVRAIDTYFFDTAGLKKIDPEFQAEKYANNYFCTGVFFAKKNVFDIEMYRELLELNMAVPKIFKFGEMGMLNYMIFKSVEQGKIKVKNHYIQHICPDFTKSRTRKMFPFKNGNPKVKTSLAIHYNGSFKPYVENILCYHRPFTFFRQQYYRNVYPRMSEFEIKNVMAQEDIPFKKVFTVKDKIFNAVPSFLRKAWLNYKQLSMSK